ncbi:MAG: hypothetical protein ACK5Y2_08890 [Bdellovibrionales bacterium]
MMSQTNLRILSAALVFLLSGCSDGFRSSTPIPSVQEEPKQSPPETTPPPVAQPAPQPQPTPPPLPEPGSPLSKICSKLDFKDVQWPATMSDNEHIYMALALNITGSFEGNLGWKNLAGDFDGQGISMGLMQQNLGQGTLQPLWIEVFQKDRATLSQNLSSGQVLSMQRMLESWLGQPIPVSKSSILSEATLEEELFPEGDSFNELDMGYPDSEFQVLNARNQASVSWARSEALDSRGQVRSSWSKPLQTIAETPFYRSLQIQTSLKYFLRAQAYLRSFGYKQVRSLLLMYDFVVQNGSIGESHLKIYNDWLQKNPSADEEQKTLALLEARLTTVRPQYRNDVRARKTTIIKGQGVVHQRQRNLPREYCFNHLDLVVERPTNLP